MNIDLHTVVHAFSTGIFVLYLGGTVHGDSRVVDHQFNQKCWFSRIWTDFLLNVNYSDFFYCKLFVNIDGPGFHKKCLTACSP